MDLLGNYYGTIMVLLWNYQGTGHLIGYRERGGGEG
jgi:hypothetical protein